MAQFIGGDSFVLQKFLLHKFQMSNNPYQGGGPYDHTYKPTYGNSSDLNKNQYTPGLTRPNQYIQPSYTNPNNLLNQPTYKQRNRAMYSSTMQFSNSSNQEFSSLDTMGRFVGDEKKQHARDDFNSQKFSDRNEQNLAYFHHYSNTHNNPNPVSNTGTSAKNQQNFFDRFPAPNLQPPKNIGNLPNQPSRQDNSGNNPNQSAQEKRKRQILEIKKQLDDLNKKMAERSSQKKVEGSQPQINPTEHRPKNNAVSQSLIFDSKYSQHNYDSTSFKTSNPVSSIQELYAKKKTAEGNRKNSFEQQKLKVQAKKPAEMQFKSPSEYKYEPLQKASNTQNKFTMKPPFQSKADQPPSVEQKFKPYNPISAQNTTENKFKAPTYSSSSTSSSEGQNKFTPPQSYGTAQKFAYKKSDPVNEPRKATSPVEQYNIPSMKKEDEPVMGFKKKKQQPAVYQVSNVEPIKTEPEKQSNPFKMKRTNSDVEESPDTEPKLKQFKKSDFLIGKKLGKGQFGEVMIVRHKQTGFLCGLKVMEKKQIRDEQYVGQIARQLSIQFYLSHRNVAPLYGYFSDEEYVYLLIEYCIGGQLLERLRGERRMNERDVALIMKQVCEGIDYIHKQLIIHRDIKPQNILFNFGVVKISDFGWAVYRGHGLRKTASGSPLYYPPEIVKGEEYDDKIDVWNIGMMTYECLLGKIPFRIYTEMDLDRIVSDDITFPSYVDVTDEAKDFILNTMRKKGEQRMQIRQMLRHPFITKQKDTLLDASILQEFKRVLS